MQSNFQVTDTAFTLCQVGKKDAGRGRRGRRHTLPAGVVAGTCAPQPYWMAFDDPINKKFISSFREKFGQEKMVNGIGKAGCNGLHLYALAAEKAGSLKDDDVLTALPSIEFGAPQGKIRVDATNNHTLCHSYVGKAAGDGIGYEIVKDFGGDRTDPIVLQALAGTAQSRSSRELANIRRSCQTGSVPPL
jgi:hypothetical protein